MKAKFDLYSRFLFFSFLMVMGYSCNICHEMHIDENDLPVKSPCEIWLESNRSDSNPGWGGLYVGQNASQGQLYLERHRSVHNVEVIDDPTQPNRGEINWDWNWNQENLQWIGGGRAFYQIDPISSKKNIYLMYITFPCTISLDEMIQVFGEPEYAKIHMVHHFEEPSPTPEFHIGSYSLYWYQQGFVADGWPAREGMMINGEFQIYYFEFFEPKEKEYNPSDYGINVIPWHGYDDQQNYMAP